MTHTSRVCAACGKVGEIYSETHCEPCFNALAKTREAKQDPVAAFKVKVERPDPEEERARELMERRRLDEMHAVDKKPKGHEWPTDDWFARYSRIDKLCWHCQRSPGEDRFHGACEECLGTTAKLREDT